MKNKWLTGDQISPLASPSVISQIDCVSKIASKERSLSQGVSQPARSGGWLSIWSPISAISRDSFPFSLENFRGWAESSELGFGGTLVHLVWDCRLSDSRQLFLLSPPASWVLIVEWQAAGPELSRTKPCSRFHNYLRQSCEDACDSATADQCFSKWNLRKGQGSNRFLGPIPRHSDSVGHGWGPGICISDQGPGGADTAGLESTLWGPLP